MEDTAQKLIHAVRSCRLFRPMTFEEAKALCLALSEPMIRENKRAMEATLNDEDYRAAARHLVRMAVRAGTRSLSPAHLQRHFRLMVVSSRERAEIVDAFPVKSASPGVAQLAARYTP
jgi:hypothetical protein